MCDCDARDELLFVSWREFYCSGLLVSAVGNGFRHCMIPSAHQNLVYLSLGTPVVSCRVVLGRDYHAYLQIIHLPFCGSVADRMRTDLTHVAITHVVPSYHHNSSNSLLGSHIHCVYNCYATRPMRKPMLVEYKRVLQNLPTHQHAQAAH